MSPEPQQQTSDATPTNSLKRKTPPLSSPDDADRKPIILPPGANLPAGEYETGRVICEVCGGGVSFRDEPAGGFTLKHWDAHRLTALGPPAKRRRAKRTEEERIEYLRADPHVAKFEAYRVLCASCDKWIRLRPNSTYCSIPWDAHRKSCLAKKSNAKNVYAQDERNAMFGKDPDVRKFDPERLLCAMCDKWVTTPPDDHLASQVWAQHRATCQKTVSALKNVIPPSRGPGPASHGPRPAPHAHSAPPGSRASHPTNSPSHPSNSNHPSNSTHPAHPSHPHLSHPPTYLPPTHLPLPDAPHVLLDLSPANYAAPHESRRRNAEQRAATLRADVLIREVEPNRVFCSLCTKWVQLRQDSSYCAYPWLQHRGKCLARYQRRAQKASEIATLKAKRPGAGVRGEEHQHPRTSEDGDEPESEEGVVDGPSARRQQQQHQHHQHHTAHPPRHRPQQQQQHPPRAIPAGYAAARPMREWAQQQQAGMCGQGQGQGQGEGDVDADGEDVDADGDSYMEDEGATPTRGYGGNANNNGTNGAATILRRGVPASLADLDSPGGRRAFVFASVEYLFRTTYEASDDMSVSALLTYLNAAMPTDKHEDFDTGEVVRAASAFAAREKERFVLEGDMLRLLHESG
ncbi:hypothetical protein C8R44DRAFT_834277 [Mycena epipterygia]|nr:hypothetical protein C8R44DRAFT_834277 [Mycena epipterygia]